MVDSAQPSSVSTGLPEAARGEHRVVVRSIGRSPGAVSNALRGLAGGGSEEATRLLLQAPSVLVEEVSEAFAEQLATVLLDAGLEIEVIDPSVPFVPGIGDREVALFLRAPGRLREVAAAVAAFLGCDINRAAQLAWSSPALLIGKVSEATVTALQARFEPLGVELDVSVTAAAQYDVYLGEDDPGSRTLLVQALRELGVQATPRGPLLATGLTRSQADQLWSKAGRRTPVRLLDHAFQRFDLMLEGADDSPALRALLVQSTGMPDSLVPRLLGRLPTVLHAGVRYADVPGLLAPLVDAGARASARLVTFQSFDMVIEAVEDPQRALPIVHAFVGGDGLLGRLQRPPVPVAGPFTLTRALWMREELKAVGVRARLEERG